MYIIVYHSTGLLRLLLRLLVAEGLGGGRLHIVNVNKLLITSCA